MEIEVVLQKVEQVLQPRQLAPIEKFVFQQSWLGHTYNEMAENSGYGSDYIKEIGSHLWQSLSAVLGEKVTKKNLHLVLGQYQDSTQVFLPPEVPLSLDGQSRRSPTLLPLQPIVRSPIHFPSGPLPLESPLYIERPPVETVAYSEINQPGCVLRIKAPRRMGKTSLLNRIIDHAQTLNFNAVYVDFQEADRELFQSLNRFLRWFSANVSRQLNLEPNLDQYWDVDIGSKVSCKVYFEEHILGASDRPLVLVLNEVNTVFEHSEIAQDFLPMLRFWHEQGKQNPVWQKLRQVFAHATDVYVLRNLNQSPFNVGVSLQLPCFTFDQVQDLAQRYGLQGALSESRRNLVPLYEMVGGHPYLVSLAFHYLVRGQATLEDLFRNLTNPNGIYGQHLLEQLNIMRQNPALMESLRTVIATEEGVPVEAIAAYQLESMGLILLDGNRAYPLCNLYRLYFQEQFREDKSRS